MHETSLHFAMPHILMLLAAATGAFGRVDNPAVTIFPDRSNIPAPLLSWPPKPPYAHTVKVFTGSATLSAANCQAACAAFVNEAVSPVSNWERCQSFTWLPSEGRGRDPQCVVMVDASEWAPVVDSGAVSGRLEWPPPACSSNSDCSFNGLCIAKACLCDDAWHGDRCHTLSLEPTHVDSGLRAVDDGQNTSTWGGAVLLDNHTGIFHMWSSEMEAHCGIDAWVTNSRVVHATSTDGVNFIRDSVVVPAFSHEPNVVRAPTGEWVMYYTGLAQDSAATPPCDQCTDGNTPANSTCPTGASTAGRATPTYMIYAMSPIGPWSKPQRLFIAQANETDVDTNLAVVILQNGSVLGIGRTAGGPVGIVTHLVTASDWRNADSYTGLWSVNLFPNTTIVPYAGLEDPFVYMDAAGIFHAVFHNQIEADDESLCGGHAFSEDGITWTFTGTAWNNEVRFRAGVQAAFKYRFSRMERPHLVFGDVKAPFRITALTTGVQFGKRAPVSVAGEDACYTLLQPVSSRAVPTHKEVVWIV